MKQLPMFKKVNNMLLTSKDCLLLLFYLTFIVTTGFSQTNNEVDSLNRKQGQWYYRISKDSINSTGELDYLDDPSILCFFTNDTLDKEFTLLNGERPILCFSYKMGKKNGVQKEYGTNSSLKELSFFQEGELLYILFFDTNGRVAEEVQFKNNVKDGVSRIYNDEGKILQSKTFVKGKLEGDVIHYNKKGQITIIDIYKDDKLINMIIVPKRSRSKR